MMAVGPQLTALLARYGLGSLTNWASQMLIKGLSEEEIQLQLFDRPEFQRAFPEIEARRKKAQQTGLFIAPISADDILTYRAQARTMMRSRGLPADFYAQDTDFADLIVNDVSLDELNTRLDLAEARVWQAPPQVREVFDELMGINGTSALFSIFVDTKRSLPSLENLVTRAEVGGAARRFNFNLGREDIERVAVTNVDYEAALTGFSELDVRRGLFDESLFETQDFTIEEEGIAAAFGLEGGAQRRLEQRAEARTAQTKGASGGLIEERGATGLGGAGRR